MRQLLQNTPTTHTSTARQIKSGIHIFKDFSAKACLHTPSSSCRCSE